MKPDLIAYDKDGEKTSEAWSKTRVDARDKVKKQIVNFAKSIKRALENSDFDELKNML